MIAKTIGQLRELLKGLHAKHDDDLIGIMWSEPPNDDAPMIILDGVEMKDSTTGPYIDVSLHEQTDDETCEDCGAYVPLTDPVAEPVLCEECAIDRKKDAADLVRYNAIDPDDRR